MPIGVSSGRGTAEDAPVAREVDRRQLDSPRRRAWFAQERVRLFIP
ncbi:MAG: hypothetical protein NZ874_00345 [Fimbriimonadales bacterium]|nr:hypothetical protein [Fimbriimonadales bacterium]